MMDAATLFIGQSLSGAIPAVVTGVSRDSRLTRPGEVYIATGPATDQPVHARQAIATIA